MTATRNVPVLHRIWLGGPIPDVYNHFDRFDRLHPHWELKLWGDDDLDGWPVSPLLRRADELAPANDRVRWKVDILRLAVLDRYGGIYVDCDTSPHRPLDPLLQHDAFVAQSPNDLSKATNAVMGATPNHPYIQALIDGLEARCEQHPGGRVVRTVGGFWLTDLLPNFPDVQMLPWWLFAGQAIRDRNRGNRRDPRNAAEGFVDHTYQNSARRSARKRRRTS